MQQSLASQPFNHACVFGPLIALLSSALHPEVELLLLPLWRIQVRIGLHAGESRHFDSSNVDYQPVAGSITSSSSV